MAMKTTKTMLLLGTCLAMLVLADTANAQQRRRERGLNLNRPTFSPWLQLFNNNPGPLDNYHQYVRPEMRLRQTLANQELSLMQQSTAIGVLDQRQQMMGRPIGISPTGTTTGATFMDTSHYFPLNRGTTRR
jgi:hypothetical protein